MTDLGFRRKLDVVNDSRRGAKHGLMDHNRGVEDELWAPSTTNKQTKQNKTECLHSQTGRLGSR